MPNPYVQNHKFTRSLFFEIRRKTRRFFRNIEKHLISGKSGAAGLAGLLALLTDGNEVDSIRQMFEINHNGCNWSWSVCTNCRQSMEDIQLMFHWTLSCVHFRTYPLSKYFFLNALSMQKFKQKGYLTGLSRCPYFVTFQERCCLYLVVQINAD